MDSDRIELVEQHAHWAALAEAETQRIYSALGEALLEAHHIGSTAVSDLPAKPIVDLLAVVKSLDELEKKQQALEELGYDWRGEYGIEGRRYCTASDPRSGRRAFHLHCYKAGHPQIAIHLNFRDLLRRRPQVAALYAEEKRRCCALHPEDSAAYTACKAGWIERTISAELGSSPDDSR